MTITRVNGAGWSIGEKYTSSQCNSMDINATNALDKRSGQTDTLSSVVTCASAGRIIPSTVLGANADTTYLVSGGNSAIYVDSTISVDRIYTLSHTNANAGDLLFVYALPTLTKKITVKDITGPTTLFVIGNTLNEDGNFASFIYLGTTWHLYQSSAGSRLRYASFDTNGTFTVPSGVDQIHILGWGGGGGGGGGAGGHTGTDRWMTGGGGGGAALTGHAMRTVTPGAALAVTIGAGGSAGGGGVDGAGTDGGNATSSLVDGITVGQGATGGKGGILLTTASVFAYVNGGRPVPGGLSANPTTLATSTVPLIELGVSPGWGGYGVDNRLILGSAPGANAIEGSTGGTAGTSGVDDGSYRGGGGGGGGAAGPLGSGGNGGNGTAGTSTSVSGTGVNGTGGGSNAGSGGGGGGASGDGITGANAGGNGGAGSAGKVFISWVK